MDRLLAAAAIALILALPSFAPANAQDPMSKPDGSWITISGVVASATDNAFMLDYGEGLVTVEMDDWDWYPDGRSLIEGDNVIVKGRIDNDFYETATIEAGSVYVKGLNAYFYASAADEEALGFYPSRRPNDVAQLELTGTVTSVDGREFTLDTGDRQIKVDTISMLYNPMDDQGYQRVKEGDWVKVIGEMDYDVFEKKELMADVVVTLMRDKTKKSS